MEPGDDLPPPSANLVMLAVLVTALASLLPKLARSEFLDRVETTFGRLEKISARRPIRDGNGHAIAMEEFGRAERWWKAVRPLIRRAAR